MNMDLKSYVKVFKAAIPDGVCNQSLKELENAEWHQHVFYNAATGKTESVSGDRELDTSNKEISTKPAIRDCVYMSIGNYVAGLNFPWYNRWQDFTQIRFNRYQETKMMALHCDHIHSLFPGDKKGVPVLSVVGALNDGYEGGEFIMFEDTHIELPKGAIMVFPSNFMYPHTVLPVTKGVRHSFVSWVI